MVNGQGLILHKTRHKGGRHHDYHLYKHNRPVTPSQVENIVDPGYLGIQKDFIERVITSCPNCLQPVIAKEMSLHIYSLESKQ